MSISFANIGALWAALVDAMSGKTSVVQVPPVISQYWYSTNNPMAVVSGGNVVLTTDTPAGSLDLIAPLPADTLAGFLAANTPEWRRSLVLSFYDSFSCPPEVRALECRQVLINTCWPSVFTGQSTGFWPTLIPLGDAAAELQYMVSGIGDPNVSITPGAMPGIKVCGTITESMDIYTRLLLYTGNGAYVMTPSTPDDQMPVSTLFSAPGGGVIDILGNNMLALNALAIAMARASAVTGRLSTHRSVPLIAMSGQVGALPPMHNTSEAVMHRVAAAARLLFGGDIVLFRQKPMGRIAVTKGVIASGWK